MLFRTFSLSPALAVVGIGLTALLATPAAHAQANLTFTGGNGSPLSLTLGSPVTYTVTTSSVGGPVFVFQGVGNLAFGSPSTGTITYRINGGTPQAVNFGSSGNLGVSIAANDLLIFGPSTSVTVGDIVTLASGTLTTTSNVAAARPTNGSFATFITDGIGNRLSSNGTANAPEPGSLALAVPFMVGGGVGLVRRRKRS